MSTRNREDFEEVLRALGELLSERGLRFEFLAIGGGALQLLGLIVRPTADIDVVAQVDKAKLLPMATLPAPFEGAVRDTAAIFQLPATWLNLGPRSLTDLGLPDGILERAHRREWGGLVLHVADRRDQIFFKYAAVDQGPRSKHFEDLRRLEPTVQELRAAATWVLTHDASLGFRNELTAALRELGASDVDV